MDHTTYERCFPPCICTALEKRFGNTLYRDTRVLACCVVIVRKVQATASEDDAMSGRIGAVAVVADMACNFLTL